MSKYPTLDRLYEDGLRDKLIEALMPWLDLWAKDVLKHTLQKNNYSMREELVLVCADTLREIVDQGLSDRRFMSGEHLVNSLRLAVRTDMRRAFDKAVKHVTATAGGPDAAADEAYRDADLTRQERRWRFIDMIARAVREQAAGGDIQLVNAICSANTFASAAKACGMSREAARSRMRRLKATMLETASEELKELGDEFYPKSWTLPA